MGSRILGLVAAATEGGEERRRRGRGHPPTSLVRVLTTLRRFLREGTLWRGRRATVTQASGSTLRRGQEAWSRSGLLARGHGLLVAMRRGHPDLALDSGSVGAKRGGDLTGPNPTDRAMQGSKHHIAVAGGGVPVG